MADKDDTSYSEDLKKAHVALVNPKLAAEPSISAHPADRSNYELIWEHCTAKRWNRIQALLYLA